MVEVSAEGALTLNALAAAYPTPEKMAERVGGWVLVGLPPNSPSTWSFQTQDAHLVRRQTGEGMVVLAPHCIVYPLRKAKYGAFMNTVLVGRSRSNDVILNSPDVSKLHARVRISEDLVEISDADSSNGTVISDRKLKLDEWTEVRSGSLISLGDYSIRLLNLEDLVEIVRKLQ